ncbi:MULTISPECIES: hypothetical protein [Lentzea]|uniref:Uncharacterized protein n=1 Tax=Lentzea sokolovensis TaxID=3095429 RepID=A0ABU4V889_9PSEU|nr:MULTISPECIES: hypothetical protein [Lentzea]MDX8148015.1 hypothetical protein [Lentzea sp. BCCO 10_0061]
MDKQAVRKGLDRPRDSIHLLLDGAAAEQLKRRSNGTNWNNREPLFHMLLGF